MSDTTSNFTDCDQNIEIKALIPSEVEYNKKIEIAKNLTKTNGELIEQRDIFFQSKSGRLKLRYEVNRSAQLIFYDRKNISGPKLSNYSKTIIEEPKVLEKILSQSNGEIGIVKKKRLLFIYKNCRIHLDQVDGLGNFLEFEVVLGHSLSSTEKMSIENGQKFANEMMKIFEIKEEHLLEGAYIDDLLVKSK